MGLADTIKARATKTKVALQGIAEDREEVEGLGLDSQEDLMTGFAIDYLA